MPYYIRKVGDEWCLFKKDTGENVGCSESEKMAISHMRARLASDHGWKPTGKPFTREKK